MNNHHTDCIYELFVAMWHHNGGSPKTMIYIQKTSPVDSR